MIDHNVIELLVEKLPLIEAWIEQTIRSSAPRARRVSELGFRRLPAYYPADVLGRAKVVVAEQSVVPPLRQMGLDLPALLAFEQGDYDGITYLDTYFVKPSRIGDEALHFPELGHVTQWQQLGPQPFLIAYAIGLLQHGYRNSPLEAIACHHQERFEQSATPYNIASSVALDIAAQVTPLVKQALSAT